LIWLYLTNETNLLAGRPLKLLHVAPEPRLSKLLSSLPGVDYLSGDIRQGAAMVEMDITDIQYPEGAFDVVYCSHVLEHVVDDRKAMREFFRVLRPGGWAVLQVPIGRETTFEDFSVVDPADRKRVFGQSDHVRIYGLDYPDRLREAGFDVDVVPYAERFSKSAQKKMGLRLDHQIYHCRKAA
jgi:SAM-dependent methyltransferase